MKHYSEYREGRTDRQRTTAEAERRRRISNPLSPKSIAACASGARRPAALFTLAALLVLPLLAGCALLGPPRGEPDYANVGLSPDSLVALVNRQALTLGAVRGSGTLIVRTPDYPRGRKVDVSLIARRPESVRVRGRVGILASIFDFVADADSLRLYLPRESALVAVANEPGGRALSIVASRELVEALLPAVSGAGDKGGPPVVTRTPEGYEVLRRSIDEAGRTWIRRLLYEPERLRLVRADILENGDAASEPRATIRYAAHRWTGHAWFPGRISLELPAEGQGLDLKFDTFEPNPPIAPELFALTVPRGTRRVDPADLGDDFLLQAPPGD